MKHYIDENNEVHAFDEDGSQDHLITNNLTHISNADLAIMRTPLQSEVDEQINSVIDAELKQGDLDSIRILLEWASEQPDAPQLLKDKKLAQDVKRASKR